MALQLYIGNKNYSSWSMRAWLALREAGIDFEERRLRLSFDGDPAFRRQLEAVSPVGKVPVLVDDGFAVWDTLAIVEYLAERFPERGLWPADARRRARARCLCAEMHSGFQALRGGCPMNIEASLPEVGARQAADPGVAADLRRIDSMWSEALAESGGPFLFGDWSAADAFYAPVASRIRSYALPLGDAASAYAERVLGLPGARQWIAEALAEHDFVPFDEPYRNAPV